MKQDLQANKQNAIELYRTAYPGNPSRAVEVYVGEDYIQHTPLVGDGKQPFSTTSKPWRKTIPIKVSNLYAQSPKVIW